jgi:hypothetical protein
LAVCGKTTLSLSLKKIEAIVRSFKMEDVKDALTQPASTASRREPARRWHAADGLSLGAVGEARQGRDPARRNAGKNQ